MSESSEFYDVKISQDIISEKERNIITNSLIKNEENNINDKQSDNNRKWYNNTYFLFSALLFTSIVISTCIYLCYFCG
jgi:hypothetical protein